MGQIGHFLLAGRFGQDRHLVFLADQHLVVRFHGTQQRLAEGRTQELHYFLSRILGGNITVLHLGSCIVGKLVVQLSFELDRLDLHFSVSNLALAAQLA
ncbi:hypothetical protein D3C73_1102510 [compost metagenome]